MRIGPLNPLTPREIPGLAEDSPAFRTGAVAPGVQTGATTATEKTGFSKVLSQAVSEINGKMQTAQAEQTKVLTGESTNLHQAMISMQEANVAFSLMVEVRNKLVESYQEMMRMQV